ncbi:MAG TPA: hypothetical protein VGP81_11240 [Pyrinomonadaceae bacterium]|jgi:hypothetical protein|nr:hypothetical protein [Pyrinomonadaceae bacterium]
MKRTEIIIETQRVTVIQRRRHSNQDGYDASLINMPIVDVADGDNAESSNDEVGNFKIPGEEKEQCIDSRNR